MPFSAHWHLRWKASNDYTNMETNNGSAWAIAVPAWDFSGDVNKSGDYIELRIPLSDIGYPVTVKLHVSMINEAVGAEGTYAGMPSTSFADGYPPNYTKYFLFDLKAMKKPN